MTLRKSAPRGKQQWLALALVAIGLTALAVGAVLGHGATSIPANFFTISDQQGANDVNSEQVDLTQFGRDDSDATKFKLFWSWDSHDSWTGTGQTGDACALFDNDGDTKINFAICARVTNLDANPEDVRLVQQDATHPVFAFECSDAKNDRCTQPTGPLPYSSPTQVDAGVIGTLAKANLITETDPFAAGEDFPHDTTLEVDILKSFVPGAEVLVNVCSYPSAGNGGNNNPFDCIVNPGGGFLSIVKDAGAGVTSPTFGFSVNTSPATLRSISGSGTASPVALFVTTTAAVTETTIPSPWELQSVSCRKADGTTSTGTADLANHKITGITIESGLVTTCTFVDRIPNGTLIVIKHVVNDNGGSATASQFTYTLGDGSSATSEAGAESPGTSYVRPVTTSYNVAENSGPTGYTVSYSADCSGQVTSTTKTCTITNDDDAATLIVIKHVINDNGGTAVAADFTLDSGGANDSPDNFAGAESPGTAVTLDAGSYDVTESGPSGYTASYSADCSGSIANGESKTCTVTNDDVKASPGISTSMSWTLHDSVALTGFRSGGDASTVHFYLFLDDDTCSDSEALVFDQERPVDDSDGTASTLGGYETSVSGTYYWFVTFSGNTHNEANDGSGTCGDEVTTLP